ncbi:protein translocase subunit SecF [Pelagerythrobacter marensis]|uniref:Protein-export membrane protein SecF n=1 Tax=Pelagerythrobacter marensis TaxID=543877 RepID=A0A0G3X5I0_9SPHN|nr:protein translocase subunit SecF [Pelagerythrobacter marensis]AKM06775.1 Protein-export membrane protein SecF [Pelagerythrobacter marensis]
MKLLKLVPDDTNIKFLRWRVPFYVVSILLIAASWGLVLTKGLNYGVDFAGGLNITATFTESTEAPVGDLRDTVSELGYGEPVVQRFGDDNQVSIRVPLPDSVEGNPEAAQNIANAIVAELEASFADFRLDGNENVSGKVSDEFRSDAAFALIAAMLAVALYIWIRFEWQFGVGALFALFHDVSLTLGMFSLFQLEFSLQIIAAILAIIGYSLNDTIVVYDRIRENLKKYRKMPTPELLDLSVNETLARTVMTSLTLLIALVPLLAFGPASLFGMVAAITLGIFVGTYSSVYMAAPILIWLGVDSHSFVPTETEADKQDKIARGEA